MDNQDNQFLKPFKRGKASTDESVREILQPLVDVILTEHDKLSFSPTARGWAYILEGLGVCSKGDFENVGARITRARKMGMLPLNITAEDETRSTNGGSWITRDLPTMIRDEITGIADFYSSCVIEEFTGIHLELVVEKLDLVGMLQNITRRYRIPVTCSRGWSDLHLRAEMIRRCTKYKMPTVILMFGDHDPGGLSITESFKDNLAELLPALGMDCLPDMTFDRVGLNADDIDRLGLTWIDGLETSGGVDLASPKHKQHSSKPVQDYLSRFGARKCEANALLRNPDAAEAIMQKAIDRYVNPHYLMAYEEAREDDRQTAHQAITKALAAIAA